MKFKERRNDRNNDFRRVTMTEGEKKNLAKSNTCQHMSGITLVTSIVLAGISIFYAYRADKAKNK